MNTHRLLARQLRKLGLDAHRPPDAAAWQALLTAVNQAYIESDQDRYTLERSLALSSDEMQTLYQRQKFSYETRLRTVFGTIQDLIWLKDPEGVYLACNPMFGRFFGADESEIIGKTDYDFVDKEIADFFREKDRLAMALGKPSVNEEWITFADDGHRALVETVKTPMLDENGKLIGVLGVARDITERKRSEEELRKTQSNLVTAQRLAAIGSWEWNIQNDIANWSDETYRIFGFGKNELKAHRENFLDMVHTEDRPRVDQALSDALNGTKKYDIEYRIQLDDGTVRLIHALAEIIRDDDGKPLVMTGTVQDITERKHAEEELRRYKDHLEEKVQQRTADLLLARDAAEAANRAKSVFLASMSHELRTPLNAILGFSSLLHKDPQLSQSQRDSLDIINRSGEHLLTLINDVLEMSKIEAGRVVLENAPFDLGALIRDVSDMMHVRAQEKGLRLMIEQSSEFPRYIRGDEARLRQVLINLTGNALKFTRQGGITVRFGIKPHDTQQHLLIEVEDSGIGISAEDQQRLFQPFVQLGKQVGDNKGTGLGLTITRQFVQLMGGTISVQSTPGVGSVFRVELPFERIMEGDVPGLEKIAASSEIVGVAADQPLLRILIVEDQHENQLLLSRLMDRLGFEVNVAENGEQGIQLFQHQHPHLIWMDRRMPVMDGLDAARAIRKLPGGSDVKIIAVTASAFTEERDEMLKAGIDDFVRKPYRSSEIYECLTRQLGVRYIYQEIDANASTEVLTTLTPEMLAVLPPELRAELQVALESLEEARIAAVMKQLGGIAPTLHKTISCLLDDFDYPAVLTALQKA